MPNDYFKFKQFTIHQERCALKVGTDGVLLGAWTKYEGAKRILDIGTGTGLLALVAAQRNSSAMIDAVEIDDASAEQASENVAASPWADRVRVHRMDVRRMRASEPYDLIICNPPFYAGEMDSPDERKGLAKHSGELTFEELVDAIDRLLTDDGRTSLIIPKNRENELLSAAGAKGLSASRKTSVRYLAHRPLKRALIELRRGGQQVEEDELIVEMKAGGDFSPRYRELMADLLLKF
jgi:tRNA1Val (adenine37-N6)-methyltransferase